jgi:hypothetical protein
MASCLVTNPVETWEEVVNWSIFNLKIDCLKTRLCILCLGAAVYQIWKHRNDILNGNIPSSEEARMGGESQNFGEGHLQKES